MKKLLTLFAVLALTAPVFAADGDPNVLVTIVDEGGGVAQVHYTLLAEDGFVPADDPLRGLALRISTSNTADIDAISDYATGAVPADSTQIPTGFSVFMGSIVIGPQDPNFVTDFGDPVAPSGDPGAGDDLLDAAEIVVELGTLYTGANAPGSTGMLFKLTLGANGETDTVLDIEGESTRGGDLGECVLESGQQANIVLSGVADAYKVTFESDDCMATSNPDYDEWVNNGIVSKPKCWCYEFQCRGDVLGDQEFGQFWVFQNDLAVFRAAFGQNPMPDPAAGICADFAHDTEFAQFRVFQNDLAIFRIYFGQNPIPSCSGPGSGNDENALPNSEFNFWETP